MTIAIISDIHEDIKSLERALNKINRLKCDRVICLGDISGYSKLHHTFYKTRDAHACLELLRNYCSIIIPGNHDLHAAKKIPENSQLFEYPPGWYEFDYYQKRNISKGILWLYDGEMQDPGFSEDDCLFIMKNPEFQITEIPGYRILFSHYLHPNITGSAKNFHQDFNDVLLHLDFMRSLDCDISFAGHSHPDGMEMISTSLMKQIKFSKKTKIEKNYCTIVPAILKADNRNGFLIFDTVSSEAEAVRL